MNFAVVGIGNTGFRFIEYLNSQAGTDVVSVVLRGPEKFPSSNITTVYFPEEKIHSESDLNEFWTELQINDTEFLIIVSDLAGSSSAILKAISAHTSQSTPQRAIVCGLSPFSFEGRKKSDEAMKTAEFLFEHNTDLALFSNSELLSKIDPSTSLEDALTIQFSNIYTQQISPLVTSAKLKREPVVSHTEGITTRWKVIAAAIIGAVAGAVSVLISLLFF